MRTSRRHVLMGSLVVFVLLVLSLLAVNFALDLRGNKSQVVWSNFEQSEDLDMIYIGTSIAASSFNPNLIDEEYGSNSANMATPQQKIEETYLGIRSAYERFGIARVVMTLDFTGLLLNDTPNIGSPYLIERGKAMGVGEYMRSTAWLVAERGAGSVPSSVNVLFPWISNHPAWNDGLSGIRRNLRVKFDDTPVADAAEIMDPGWFYFGKGYGNRFDSLDYDGAGVALLGELEKIETLSLDEAAIEGVREICAYCDEHDIELVVVNAPVPMFNVHGYGRFYIDSQRRVADMLADMGVAYYDFAYARPELLDIAPADFYDNQHLNAVGADKFSTAFVRLLEMLDAGEDVAGLFYTPEEFLRTIDYVSGVKASATSDDGGITVKGRAYAGSGVDVEYRISARPRGAGEWTLVQDYGDSDTARYVPGEHGTYELRVDVRAKGSDVDYDRFNTVQLIY